jgi:hypothetical protein
LNENCREDDEVGDITKLSAEIKEIPMNKLLKQSKSKTKYVQVGSSSRKLKAVQSGSNPKQNDRKFDVGKSSGSLPRKMFDPLAGP